MDPSQLSPVAILISTVASAALGALWYSPVLFGQAWMDALGIGEDDLGGAGPLIGGSVVTCLVAAITVNALIVMTGITSVAGGLALGAALGFGIVAMTMASDALFSGWSMRLYVIQMSYRALYLVMMGGICGAFA